jgi:PAS domain S-box-containing protein
MPTSDKTEDAAGGPAAQWPCGLIEVDVAGRVVEVNDRFLRQIGYSREEVFGCRRWSDLLTAGSRLLFEAQLAPVLALGGAVDEMMVDLAGSGGERIPALMSAEPVLDHGQRMVGCRIALMAVPDRREYENNRTHTHAGGWSCSPPPIPPWRAALTSTSRSPGWPARSCARSPSGV